MADTVSNHDKHIATKGSSHVAQAVPATGDVCFDACKQPTVLGNNYVNSDKLGTGQTTKTTIYDEPIWTEGGWLDSAPSAPAHAGTLGGVNKNVGANGQLNYINFAEPTAWSPDVKAEGKGVVRTDDATEQNGGNCVGFTDGKNLAKDVDTEADYLKKKCVITKVTGECAHGRPLGAPPNADKGADGYYLDVTAEGDEVVTIDIERKDLTTNSPAACGKHTDWVARRKGQGEGDGEEHKEVTDHLVLKGAILVNPMPPKLIPGVSLSHSFGKTGGTGGQLGRRAERRLLNNNIESAAGRGESTARRSTARRSVNNREDFWKEAGNRNASSTGNNLVAGASAAVDVGKLIMALMTHWKYEQNPPVVNATGTACGGAKNIKLRVFPPDEVKYTLPKKWMEDKMSPLMNLGRTVEWAANKFALARGAWKWEVCGGFEFGFILALKELDHDENGYTKTQVRRRWDVYMSTQPLVGIFLEGKLSLLMILGTIFTPLVGKAVDFAAGKLGVSVDGFINVEGTLPVTIAVGKDQYENWNVSGSKVALSLVFKIGVRAVYEGRAGHLTVEVAGVMENSLEVTNFRKPDDGKEGWFQMDFTGYIQLGAYASYSADLFNWNWASRKTIGIKDSGSAEWKPSELKFPKSARGSTAKPFWSPVVFGS